MNLAQLRHTIKKHEGKRPWAYQDSLSYWTIGVGHCIDRRKGGRLPDHIIESLLDYDIERVIQQLDAKYPWWRECKEPAQRALAEMTFQLGIGGLSTFRKMLAALEEGDYEEAAVQAMDSKWATQTPVRARHVAALFRMGE